MHNVVSRIKNNVYLTTSRNRTVQLIFGTLLMTCALRFFGIIMLIPPRLRKDSSGTSSFRWSGRARFLPRPGVVRSAPQAPQGAGADRRNDPPACWWRVCFAPIKGRTAGHSRSRDCRQQQHSELASCTGDLFLEILRGPFRTVTASSQKPQGFWEARGRLAVGASGACVYLAKTRHPRADFSAWGWFFLRR